MKNIHFLREIPKFFPKPLCDEILAICNSGRMPNEIRLRKRGLSNLVFGEESIVLEQILPEDVDAVFSAICRGAPYAYRDTVARGFVPLDGGVRVGVAGRARYDEGRLVGISNVESLVFRLPVGGCDFSQEILDISLRARGGILIFSPPFGGKTTALRSLSADLSQTRRVVIVDEREEIWTEALEGRNIDLLSGYKRAYGISLATRCLAPELIITDEISSEDAEEILAAANSGVPIIATAHASSARELMHRESLARLISEGVFSTIVGIYRAEGRFVCREERVEI